MTSASRFAATQAHGLGRTQWVDQTIQNVREALIEKGVDKAWLPRELPPDKAPREHSVEEFGCGAYGCVMPTNQQGLVLKITSDASEAWFAQIAHELSRKEGWPKGIVHYRRVVGLADQTLDNQQLYLLWRTEAFEVGKLHKELPMLMGAAQTYMEILDVMHEESKLDHDVLKALSSRALSEEMLQDGRNYILDQAAQDQSFIEIAEWVERFDDEAFKLAVQLLCLYAVAEEIEQAYPQTRALGSTIRYYLDKGLLLGDLHMGNMGLNAQGTVVVADPGLVFPLKQPWFHTPFPKRLLVRS